MTLFRLIPLFFAVSLAWLTAVQASLGSDTLYLTWRQDPTSTMVVQWITPSNEGENELFYRHANQHVWCKVQAETIPFPLSQQHAIHRVELTQLEPDHDYIIRLVDSQEEVHFKTMPKTLQDPVRIVVGGDMYHDGLDILAETCRQAAKTDPNFAMVGGDIAYAVGSSKETTQKIDRWIEWLQTWHKEMVAPDGRSIPVVAAIGNHDLCGQYDQPLSQAAVFMALFPRTTETTSQVLDFGSYLSLFILDSGHAQPVGGKQSLWLKEALKTRQTVLHRFALYHVPAYPSVRLYSDSKSTEIRRQWVPLFDEGNLHIAFENHDHAYKRTFPLRKNQKDPKGVLYVGDGAWGVAKPRRPIATKGRGYLEKYAQSRNFVLINLQGTNRKLTALSSTGMLLDNF